MYAQFFGLRELPFNNTPDPRFFFATPDHEEALASLIYAVQERKGFVLLTGEIGAGKTLISRMMLRHFGTMVEFATINHAIQDARDLLESICSEFELHIPPGASRTVVVRLLHDHLLAQFARNQPVVLVLDEAQNLSVDSFEQLRMIGNLEADDAKLLQIVIVGQPELQQRFASPDLCQLRQRIFRSYHLPAMSRESSEGYIRHRLAVAGDEGHSTFSSDAIDRVFEFSKGVPRVINTLCDNAMLSAYSADKNEIDAAFVQCVIGQMMMSAQAEPVAEFIEPAMQHPVAAPPARTDVQPTQPVIAMRQAASESGTRHAVERPLIPAALHAPAQPTAPQPDARPANASPHPRHTYRPIEPVRPLPSPVATAASAGARAIQNQLNRETQTLVDKARSVRSELEPLIRRAEALLTRTELAVRDLDHKEERLQNVDRVVSGVVRDLRSLLERAQRLVPPPSTGLQATRHNAQQLADEAANCRRIADRIAQRSTGRPRQPERGDLDAEKARVLRSVEAVRSHVNGSRERAEQLRERLKSITPPAPIGNESHGTSDGDLGSGSSGKPNGKLAEVAVVTSEAND